MITEDRRRRIHSAREVQENAVKLKKSAKYHKAAAPKSEAVHAQIGTYEQLSGSRNNPNWNEEDFDIDEGPRTKDSPIFRRSFSRFTGVEDGGRSQQVSARSQPRQSVTKIRTTNKEIPQTIAKSPPEWKLSRVTGTRDGQKRWGKPTRFSSRGSGWEMTLDNFWEDRALKVHSAKGLAKLERQIQDFSWPVVKMSSNEVDPKSIDSRRCIMKSRQSLLAKNMHEVLVSRKGTSATIIAAALATKAFADGLEIYHLGEPLLDAYDKLCRKCVETKKLAVYEVLLSKLLSFGPFEEDINTRLGIEHVVDHLLQDSGYEHISGSKDITKLKRALTIYKTKHVCKSRSLNDMMYNLGTRLLPAMLQANMYRQTAELFWHIDRRRMDREMFGANYLIFAENAQAEHRSAVKHYLTLFVGSRCRPSQNTFYNVTNAVMGSALSIGDTELAEEVLQAATFMAGTHSLLTSTTWSLKLLDEHWKQGRDYSQSLELFKRLEVSVDQTSHPKALYAVMVKISLEEGADNIALDIAKKSETRYGSPDIPTRGHFALAHAWKRDWAAVERAFEAMSMAVDDDSRPSYMEAFIPVLKHFSILHTTSETEEFLGRFIDRYGILPDANLSHLMVEIYAQSGDVDAIVEWIKFVQPKGFRVDSFAFNRILRSLEQHWHFSFQRLMQLCDSVRKIDQSMIDQATLSILRGAMPRSLRSSQLAAKVQLDHIDSFLDSPKDWREGRLQTDMSDALVKGEPGDCLKIYHTARTSGEMISPFCVAIAIEACIRQSGEEGLTRAIKLLRNAKSHGTDITPAMTPLMLFQLRAAGMNATEVDKIVNTTLFTLRQKNMDFPLSAAAKVASTLVDSKRYQQAVDMWSSLWRSHNHRSNKMDLISLTVLLKAYIGLNDFEGMKWVIGTVSRNGLVPDIPFKCTIKNARRHARHRSEEEPSNKYLQDKFTAFDECWEAVKVLRCNIVSSRAAAEARTLEIMTMAVENKLGEDTDMTSIRLSELPETTTPEVDCGAERATVANIQDVRKHRQRHPSPITLQIDYHTIFKEEQRHLVTIATM